MREQFNAARDAMRAATKAIEDCEYKLSNFELLDGSNALVPVEWHSRDETPPKGRIWASDGEGVWLISSDGTAIPGSATSVKFWTAALIPLPPSRENVINGRLLKSI